MTRGFDDPTMTFYETKLCDHDKDNWWQQCQADKSLDIENKFLTLFGCGVKITPD